MYNNILVIDVNNTIKIPQNENSYYIIKKSEVVSYSIEIIINPYQEVDTFNLFLIIKAYSLNLIYIPHMFMIAIKKKNEIKSFLVNNYHINHFKYMNYQSFSEWFANKLSEDWKYMQEDDLYSFIFTYPIDIFDRKLLNSIKPIYPWPNDIMYSTLKIVNDNKKNIEQIKTLNDKIKELENKLKEYEDVKK